MPHERLEIIRLNATGDAKRQIVCLAGRVSVFRARLVEEIALYADVLAGHVSAERFSVLLDGAAYVAGDHLHIGFDPEPTKSDLRSLHEFLIGHGFTDREIEPQLLSHGLGGLSRAPCCELAAVQQRMLIFIAALKHNDKVLILDDPFREMAETWREKFAQELAEHTWKNRVIAVVVRLGSRPDVWIDNEYVSRIQLEKPRERTIGFGGGELSSADFIQSLREELKKTAPAAGDAPPDTQPGAPAEPRHAPAQPRIVQGKTVRRAERPTLSLTAVPKPTPLLWQKPVQHAILGSAGLIMAIILLFSGRDPAQPPPRVVRQPDAVQPSPENHAQAGSASSGPVAVVDAALRPQPNIEPGSVLVQYPPDIRDAILKAFREPKSAIENLPGFKPAVERQPSQPTAVSAPPEPPPIPDSAPLYEPNTIIEPDAQTEEELEAQREQLRQHFLEAVARARERQMRETGLLPME